MYTLIKVSDLCCVQAKYGENCKCVWLVLLNGLNYRITINSIKNMLQVWTFFKQNTNQMITFKVLHVVLR